MLSGLRSCVLSDSFIESVCNACSLSLSRKSGADNKPGDECSKAEDNVVDNGRVIGCSMSGFEVVRTEEKEDDVVAEALWDSVDIDGMDDDEAEDDSNEEEDDEGEDDEDEDEETEAEEVVLISKSAS